MTTTPDPDVPDELGWTPRERVRLLRLDGFPSSFVAREAARLGLHPDGTPLAPPAPRRRPVRLANPTAAERRLVATGPPPLAPPPLRVRRVSLAEAKRAGAPWLDQLAASGHRPHPVDPRRHPVWNGGPTYHDLVASGGRL